MKVVPRLLIAAFVLFSGSLHGRSAPAAEVERELEGIKKKIEKEKQGMAKVKKQEGSILQALEGVEMELDRKNKEFKSVNRRLDSIAADLQKKEEGARKLSLSLGLRKELLRKRASALYKWQRGGSPFILLNGWSSMAELMQRKSYLELMLREDQRLMAFLSEESGRLEVLKQGLETKRKELDQERRTLVQVKETIRFEREKKKQILARLRLEEDAHTRALKELQQAALRLQKMMDEIAQKAGPPSGITGSGLERLKGSLDYPTRGKVVAGFGRATHPEFTSEIFRKGIEIEAPYGEEIRAVESGKIIFSDRFSGYGKMMIIDHGQRYYTIYAHLSDLLKHKGDTVQKGEPVALVGDSDSLQGARLYFEIRKDGRPMDPLPWFKK